MVTRAMLPVLGLVAILLSCTGEEGYPPVARIAFDPPTIFEDDGFQTPVFLDASASADPLDDPAGNIPLRYHWEFIGDEYRIDEGNENSVMPILRFRGNRPPTIRLTVTDADGLQSKARTQLRLTISE